MLIRNKGPEGGRLILNIRYNLTKFSTNAMSFHNSNTNLEN